jgi:photosystem II stability/assembly factor-like uncharacterized protein
MKTLFAFLFLFVNIQLHSQTWQVLPDSPVAGGRFEDVWFINQNTGWVVERHSIDRILKTTNGGINWVVQLDAPNNNSLRSVAFNNELLGWAGGLNGYLLRTTNGGDNWIRVDTLINPHPPGICDISVVGDSIFYGAGKWSGPARLVKTTNAGASFESINLSGYASACIGVYFVNKDTGFVGGVSNIASEGSVILYTANGGNSWTKVYISNIQTEHVWYIIPFSSNILYASVQHFSPYRMYYLISTDGGMSWTRGTIDGSNQYAEAIGFVNNMSTGWIASGAGSGMYQTTDGGSSWTFMNFGQKIHSMFVVNDTTIYACGQRIYKYTTKIVGIQNNTYTIPEDFHILYQNYPNPFNPATTIKFYLKSASHVKMRIYDLKGELIASLTDEVRNAGMNEVTWNAGDVPSGIYFYSMMTDEGILYRKAVIVK